MNWQDLNINTLGRASGQIKTICPKCHETRSNKADKSLSCNLDSGNYHCHYCNWGGNINSTGKKREYVRPELGNNTELSSEMVAWFESRGINQSTIIKMKLTEGIDWMPQQGKETKTIHFNYFENGQLVNIKHRTLTKDFKLVSGAELIPYNIDSIAGIDDCIITEGEMDCLSFVQCGFNSVISVPNGATANLEYLDRFIESHFSDKKVIYLAVDNDPKGIILRNELIRRLGAERCRIVAYNDHKDINELLTGIGEGFEAVRRAMAEAKEVRLEGVFEVEDLQDELLALFENGLKRGAVIGHKEFDELISFQTKRLMVVTGIPGHGKSEFVDEIIYRLNLAYSWKTAYFSPENHPISLHISKIISKLTGCRFEKRYLSSDDFNEAVQWINDNYYFISPNDTSDIDEILDRAKWLVRKRGIRILVLDPYNKIEHNIPSGTTETQYISKLLDKLATFAQLHDLLIILIAHPTKLRKEATGQFEIPNLYSINGSANFFNKADYGLTIYRNRLNDSVEVYVQKVKFKHLGNTGMTSFFYNLNNGRYQNIIEGSPSYSDSTNHLQKKLSAEVDNMSNEELEDLPE